jgi:biopolymer transport protein ExbD/biopolymer transport protein TolR
MAMNLGHRGVRSEINVTPLVDVVLVLLIIFMVVTPLLQRGKPVELPQGKELSAIKSGGDPIIVSVTRDGKVWIDKAEVARGGLADALADELRNHPGAAVLVKGDREVEYKTIREVVAELSKTHLMGVSLAGAQAKDEG